MDEKARRPESSFTEAHERGVVPVNSSEKGINRKLSKAEIRNPSI
jgi:hypothetical protein